MFKKDLPLIELIINPADNSFVEAIALVENPAIEVDFIHFSKQEKQQFSINDEKRELLGIAMIPNQNIYRNSSELGEYACMFSKDTIREISQVFARKGLFNSTNIEHSILPADSYIYQSYIVDSEKGIYAPKAFESIDGSWVIGVKVLNDSIWQDIKDKKIKGFSVEGLFGLIDTQTTVKLSKQDLELDKEFNEAIKELEVLEKLMNII